jgi:segregation and condensation protein B
LEVFGLASLRDLPDLEQLKAGGLLERGQGDRGLDGALGMVGLEDEIAIFENADD